jgi:uncharacterized protein YegL
VQQEAEVASPPRPGGATVKREVPFFWIVDSSGSMTGQRIQSLNAAIQGGAIPSLRELQKSSNEHRIVIRVVSFGSDVKWLIPDGVEPDNFRWPDLQAGGETAMGSALSEVAGKLAALEQNKQAKYLAPVLVLVSDGFPTDDFETGRQQLMNTQYGSIAFRFAIGIGPDADNRTLSEFIDDPRVEVMRANRAADLDRMIRLVSSTWVSQSMAGNRGGFSAPAPAAASDDALW